MDMTKLKSLIKTKNPLFSLAITGGGTGFIGQLLETGGMSQYLVDAQVPYSEKSFVSYVGGKPDKFCSKYAALNLAVAAYERAKTEKVSSNQNVFGVGFTASLHKEGQQRQGRYNGGFVAIHDNTLSMVKEIIVDEKLSRIEQERLSEQFIHDAIKIYLLSHMSVGYIMAKYYFDKFDFFQISYYSWTKKVAIIPGSFNPFHAGHQKMVETTQSILGDDFDVCLEISLKNYSKPQLDYISLRERYDSIRSFGCENTIIVNFCSTFNEKIDFYPEGTIFIIGEDTYVRMCNDIDREKCEKNKTSFLVFPRTNSVEYIKNLPSKIKDLCKFVESDVFSPINISSTELRKASEHEKD